MYKIKLGAILTAMCLMTNGAFAIDLTLRDAIEKIVKESEDVKKSDIAIRKAQAGLDVANSNRWFKLDGSATYMNLVNVERPFDSSGTALPPALGGLIGGMTGQTIVMPDNLFIMGATITQPIYTFGKIGNAVEGMRSAIKISELGADLTSREVKYAAANIYWTAKMTDELVVIYQKSLDDAVSARAKLTSAGRANRGNLIKIESDIATKEINLSDAKFNRDTSHSMLKILAGIDSDMPINLTDAIPSKFSEIKAKSLKANPEWDILDQQIKMYEANAKSKRAGHYPTLAATASYNYVALHNDINVFNGTKTQSANVGLALQIPIFDGGLSRANATIEAMNAESAHQDLNKSKKLKAEEYNTALQKHEHLRGNLSALENAKNLAQKAYNISRDRFAAGQTSAIELAEVSNALSGIDMALLNAKYNILMSEELVKKIGE